MAKREVVLCLQQLSFGGRSHSLRRSGELVRVLVDARASVNKARADGLTPLSIASQNNAKWEPVRLLLSALANAEAAHPADGATALLMAAEFGNLEVVHHLLRFAASTNVSKSTTGATPLFVASQQVCSWLLEQTATSHGHKADARLCSLHQKRAICRWHNGS
ncbi:Psmd10 [Symbiodinium microadriaticum]|nr:Psmd10 [Symbiodinium sp. KB8]CAE7371501.1 Psmd10 [Symbiodinium microadriaticum]